jgi:hypothetical protein
MRADLSFLAGSVLYLSLVASAPLAAADESGDKITLKGGSVLIGEIERVENDELILDTDYADDVVIEVEYIVNIESKQQFSVRLLGGEIISGFLAVSNGRLVLRESLHPPGEPIEPEKPAEFDLPDTGVEVTASKTDPGASDFAQPESPPIDESPQQSGPDDFRSGEETAETARVADVVSPESPTLEEPPTGRRFTFEDIDWIREKPTYLRYDAELNVGAQLARGNSDTTDLHFDARFEPSFGWNTFRLTGQYDKKTADGDTTTNRWKAALEYQRDFKRRWFAGAANSYESDAQRNLDLRFIFAAGVGYRFFDEDPTHFSVLPALAYVNEKFSTDTVDTGGGGFQPSTDFDDLHKDYVAFQLNTNFEHDLYKDDITFFNKNMYLNNLQSLSDIIVETRIGIDFDMAWDLVLTLEFEADWENEPAEDTKKLDTRYMLKIGFEFEGDEEDWFH